MKASTAEILFLAGFVLTMSTCGSDGVPGLTGTDLPGFNDAVTDDGGGPQPDNPADISPTADDGFASDAVGDMVFADAWDDAESVSLPDQGGDTVSGDHLDESGLDVPADEVDGSSWDVATDAPDNADAGGKKDVPPPPPGPCDPCQDDGDCGGTGLCMDLDLSVFVCGVHCGPNQQCPTGMLCEVAPTSAGPVSAQCIPADICQCNDALEGQTHACSKTNLYGQCHGVETCSAGTWSQCDAPEPAAEKCNAVDDDCDGETDEGFGTITCGLGVCKHTVPACDANGPALCDPMEGAQAIDLPDTEGVDADCDGIDGTEALSVFVASSGLDSNPGSKDLPKRTITAGIKTAKLEGKRDVLVSEGLYQETLEFVGGINVHAGYRVYEDWKRYQNSKAEVFGGTVGAKAEGIDQPTVVTRLRIKSASALEPGESSIGLWLSGSTSALRFEECEIHAGPGAPGDTGAKGDVATKGENGGQGGKGCENAGGFCDKCSMPEAGQPGKSGCGHDGGIGGKPGYGDGKGEAGGDGCCTSQGGDGGASGKDGVNGEDADEDGVDGSDGNGGKAGLEVSDSGITANDGEPGEPGTPGNGGGGGGGGGGGKGVCPDFGGAGGGGGAGGCGG
ncbi:MAG: hypothetical protein GXP54_01890, partial [Deltaproteobacteria bacterium]|nr:hypothetical protein [Deltaproteobacteria bacterium]